MDSYYHNILDAALSCWSDYQPTPKTCESVGVDSSWNKRSFQGLDLYAVDAVSVNSENEILGAQWDTGLRLIRNEMLESKALFMESRVKEIATKKRDIDVISIDGSLASRFRQNNEEDIMQILDIIKKIIMSYLYQRIQIPKHNFRLWAQRLLICFISIILVIRRALVLLSKITKQIQNAEISSKYMHD